MKLKDICVAVLAIPVTQIMMSSSSVAQTTQTEYSYSGIEEIMVTAQRRSQSLQDVGMSITAVDSDALERRDISSAYDLTKVVPSLSVANAGNGATIVYTLRGVGFNSSNLGATSAVAVYLDEIPLPYPIMTQAVGLDLQRVEVYKGPQGTLFGQNSTGGAINYIANKPTDEFSSGVDFTYGRFNQWALEGYISGSVSENLKVRVAALKEGGSGWQKSYTHNGSLGSRDKSAIRILADWEATDSVRVNAGINTWWDRSDSQAVQFIEYAPLLPPGLPEVASLAPAPRNNREANWSPREIYQGAQKDYEYDSRFVQPFLKADFDITEKTTLTSVSTYSKFDTDSLMDPDGTVFEIGEIRQFGDIKDFNQEIRIAGEGKKTNWIVGANYQKNKIKENLDILLLNLSNVQNMGGTGFSAHISPIRTKQETESKAVFGNLEYEFTEQLTAVLGVRYTETKIDFVGCNIDSGPPILNSPTPGVTSSLRGFFNILYSDLTGDPSDPIAEGECVTLDNVSRNGQPPTFKPTNSQQTLDEDNVSWNATLNFKPTSETLLYGRLAKGFKSGSFPTVGASTSQQYLPAKQESLLAYEVGFKASLWDRRIQIDGAVFYYDYKDKQLSNFIPDNVFGPLVAIVNVPDSKVHGAEFSLTMYPLEGLMINSHMSYIETEIKKFNGFDVDGNPADLRGEEFNFSPKVSGGLDLEYRFPVTQTLNGSVGGSITYRSKTSGVIGATTPNYAIDSYALFDVQAGIESVSGWSLRLWGKNITNKYYWTNANRISDTIVRTAGNPRTYGITVSHRF